MNSRRQAFPKAARLLRASDYHRVFDSPVALRTTSLTVLSRVNTQFCARLGLAVSRKQLRLATERNRFKRVVREQFRLHLGLLPRVDLVVIPTAQTAKEPESVIANSLRQVFSKLCA